MKALGKKLRSGAIKISPDQRTVEIKCPSGLVTDVIHYNDLTACDWGFVYERHVAQQLEGSVYLVEMRGLAKGFLDEGIDLVARKAQSRIFIQCKHAIQRKISKQEIEWIFYNASHFLESQYAGEKLMFWLVVPSMESAFSKKS